MKKTKKLITKNDMSSIQNIKEVTEPLKEEILKGDVHTIDEIRKLLH